MLKQENQRKNKISDIILSLDEMLTDYGDLEVEEWSMTITPESQYILNKE